MATNEPTKDGKMAEEVKMPITYEDLKKDMVDSGRPYDFAMIYRAYALAEQAHGGQRRRSQTGLRPTHFHAVLCSAQTYGKSALSHWHNRTFRVFRRRLFRCRMPYGALDAVRGRRGKRPDGGGGHTGRGTYRVFAR